ncbi:MAG: nucleotidyltransferase domain-containing protein [Ruminococcaceae bacterium]|nr:nucleotidyltransferase domain-containing protein [Oscillospiraceae bacterium]
MTYAEHLIENAISYLESGKSFEEFCKAKHNTEMALGAGINMEHVWQMARHVLYTLKPMWEEASDEEKGVLSLEDIKQACKCIFDEYEVEYCILFGSYAKGVATEKSDVDLLISSKVTGLRFFGLAERLRTSLRKKVDLIEVHLVDTQSELYAGIIAEGIKIYGI